MCFLSPLIPGNSPTAGDQGTHLGCKYLLSKRMQFYPERPISEHRFLLPIEVSPHNQHYALLELQSYHILDQKYYV